MEYFEIVLDIPNATYLPGQVVSGKVIFRSSDEETTKGILLEFEGKASVRWTETSTIRTGAGFKNGSQNQRRSYNNTDVFFESHLFLLGDGTNEGDYGKVEYILRAIVKRPFWKFDYKVKRVVNVGSIVDLNHDPQAGLQGHWEASKMFCCLWCASGPLSMTIKVPKRGYKDGDIILLEVDITNASNKVVNNLSVEIIQQFTYFAEGQRKTTATPIASASKGQQVQSFDSDFWRTEVQVPFFIPPTNLGGCRIINLDYMIKVEAHVSGAALNLTQLCPIIIGTLPLGVGQPVAAYGQIIPSAPPFSPPLSNTASYFGIN